MAFARQVRSVWVGLILALILGVSAVVLARSPGSLLVRAQQQMPFHIIVPQYLPAGYRLNQVIMAPPPGHHFEVMLNYAVVRAGKPHIVTIKESTATTNLGGITSGPPALLGHGVQGETGNGGTVLLFHQRGITTTLLGLGTSPVDLVQVASSMVTGATPVPGSNPGQIIIPLDPTLFVANPHFDGAVSLWRDGSWHQASGLAGERFAMSFPLTAAGADPVIEVYNWDEAPYVAGVEWVVYTCPRAIVTLTIVGITDGGNLVHFVSADGIRGTVNLATHSWSFATS